MDHYENDDCPIKAALQNPLILQQIFSNLSFDDIKVVRTICRAWEVEGSTLLGKQCRLRLHRLFDDYEGYQQGPTPFNPKLLQTISIRFPNSVCDKNRVVFPANVATLCFTKFASMWHHVVEEILVDMDMDMAFGLPAVLSAFGFPNLRRMKIMPGNEINSYNLQFGPAISLKELNIPSHFPSGTGNYPLLQNVINSAPNLERLHTSNFYPNLASCGKLKVFKLETDLGRRTEAIVHAENVFRMLNQVGHHLEHLKLGHYLLGDSGNVPLEKSKERFPRLPRLKSLTLIHFDFLNVMEQICPEILPNLQIVKFRHNQEYPDTSIMEEGSYLTHDGVRAMELSVRQEPYPTTATTKMFPNVKRLVIKVVEFEERMDNPGTRKLCLGTILKALSTWKLLYLGIRVQAEYNLSQLLRDLKYLSALEGLKEVRILSDSLDDDFEDYDFQEFKDVLQLSAKMDRMIFQGIKLELNTKEKVEEYLNERKDLPVFATWVE